MVLSLASSSGWHDSSYTDGQLTLCALINRSLMYLQDGNYGNAVCDLLSVVKLSPCDKTIHQTLGICYHRSVSGFVCFIFLLSVYFINTLCHLLSAYFPFFPDLKAKL